MKPFRSIVSLETPPFEFSYESKFLSLGSCFAEEMAARLTRRRFAVCVNPFGVLYNPASIARALSLLLDESYTAPLTKSARRGVYFSYDFHGSFSGEDKRAVQGQLAAQVELARNSLREADVLCITLGTSEMFRLRETAEIVANCHKEPAEKFLRESLSASQAAQLLDDVLQQIKVLNPKLNVVLTVSPIRYAVDGAWGNRLSKARLHLAAEELCKHEWISYFPAYEIMFDELRDYRFYKPDMKHPSDEAIDYIYEQFFKTFTSEKTKRTAKQIEGLMRQLEHRPMQRNSIENKNFLCKLVAELEEAENRIESVSFQEDISRLKQMINANR